MTRVRFVQRDGSEKCVELDRDVSVMLAAVRNGVSGIDGECGGCLDCATCHVYVDATQASSVLPPSDEELELLSAVSGERRPNSRLSCQLKSLAAIDELVVYVPETQS
ncbi:(2Fe-2S)-binding protein [Bradyrhizobium tropiciagri]|uniref:2Fe-2S iron-sulfur cluster-binding protein n=1 Tax=Bradyrhizobium tropiciagri TaxID=312253 RepID=UPI001BA68BAC|nr:2Fe-2S iron-sulfur cluster-binding protein [Bradyrhizobium tropiciagri]MBR0873215.1 (2Fe-2S)-binding protein [Bradyrhizobium tropiciagri]